MIRYLNRFGDRLLRALVPQAEAAAVPCGPAGACRNHKRCRYCYHYGLVCSPC